MESERRWVQYFFSLPPLKVLEWKLGLILARMGRKPKKYQTFFFSSNNHFYSWETTSSGPELVGK